MSISLTQLVVAAVTMLAGSTVLSTVGFGIGITPSPVLLMVMEPQTVVVVVNTVSVVLFVLIIAQTRRNLPVREMVPVSVAGLLGVPVGVFILSSASAGALRIAVTVLVILLTMPVAFNLRWPIPRSPLTGPAVGFAVAVLLVSTGVGGPLMALYTLTRDWSRNAVRGALSLYFLVVEFTGVVGYVVTGQFTSERFILVLAVILPALLGFGLATALLRRMNDRLFQHAVVVVIITASLMVLAREIVGR